MFGEVGFVEPGESGEVVGGAVELFDAAAYVAVEPCFGIELGKELLEQLQGIFAAIELCEGFGDFELGGDAVGGIFGGSCQLLVTLECVGPAAVLGECAGDLAKDSLIAGKSLFEPLPDGQSGGRLSLAFETAGVVAVDLGKVGAGGAKGEGSFEGSIGRGTVVGLVKGFGKQPVGDGIFGAKFSGTLQHRSGEFRFAVAKIDDGGDAECGVWRGVGGKFDRILWCCWYLRCCCCCRLEGQLFGGDRTFVSGKLQQGIAEFGDGAAVGMPRVNAVEGSAGAGVTEEGDEVTLGCQRVGGGAFIGGLEGQGCGECAEEWAEEERCQQDSADSKGDLAEICGH